MRRLGRFGALALIALALNGCAFALSALGSGAGSGAGLGLQHNVTGVVAKTYTASLPELRTAMLTTLDHMSVNVDEDKQTEEGWLIAGKAKDREITLRLQELTPNTTRARVAVDNDALFKDTATAEEILAQTSRALDEAAAVQIEAAYDKTKAGSKKMGARPLTRDSGKPSSTKAAGAKPPPATAAKIAATSDPAGSKLGVTVPSPTAVPKSPQKVALAKEHI